MYEIMHFFNMLFLNMNMNTMWQQVSKNGEKIKMHYRKIKNLYDLLTFKIWRQL